MLIGLFCVLLPNVHSATVDFLLRTFNSIPFSALSAAAAAVPNQTVWIPSFVVDGSRSLGRYVIS